MLGGGFKHLLSFTPTWVAQPPPSMENIEGFPLIFSALLGLVSFMSSMTTSQKSNCGREDSGIVISGISWA